MPTNDNDTTSLRNTLGPKSPASGTKSIDCLPASVPDATRTCPCLRVCVCVDEDDDDDAVHHVRTARRTQIRRQQQQRHRVRASTEYRGVLFKVNVPIFGRKGWRIGLHAS